MTEEELKEVLISHSAWLESKPNGVKADLSGESLFKADLYMANLSKANLYGTNLYRANLIGVNLSGADLRGATLCGADLFQADLSKAKLFEAHLSLTNLSGADLSEADLSGADLSGADLYGANLFGANLYQADLSRADLSRANLSKTIYENKLRFEFCFQKHIASWFGLDEITIGCHKKTISEWLSLYKQIGLNEGYSYQEIKEYGKFIRFCDRMYKKEIAMKQKKSKPSTTKKSGNGSHRK